MNNLILNAGFWWKSRIKSKLRAITDKNNSALKYSTGGYDNNDIKMALIADEMTYQNFKDICSVSVLSPNNWEYIMDDVKPDIFFCESAWSGTKDQNECWRYQIYSPDNLWFENRKALRGILDYCHNKKIPTVFWNKEDPSYFNDKIHNFVNTAKLFDYVFTTAGECVEGYKELGIENIDVLSFGYSDKLFYPLNGEFNRKRAVFFGSWYSNHAERSYDIEQIFDMVLSKGIKLEIYDRNSEKKDKRTEYPKKYQEFVHSGVPYEKIRETIANPCYAVNINTVKNSETMYARRALELMACGCVVISNESRGLRKRFGNNIWFAGQDFNENCINDIMESNKKLLADTDTWNIKLRDVFNKVGLKNKIS